MNAHWLSGEPHGFVFDLDGTLTRPQHDFDAIRAALGIPKGRLILEFIAEQSEARATRMRADLDEIEIALAGKAVAAPGALALVQHLHAIGQPIGILTRNSRDNAIAALKAIGLLRLFPNNCILGREAAPPKPLPDGLLLLFTHWQLPAQCCSMIGDSRLDVQAGRAAGCYTVHVSRANERWPDHTDLHVPHLQALADHLTAV